MGALFYFPAERDDREDMQLNMPYGQEESTFWCYLSPHEKTSASKQITFFLHEVV